MDKREIREITKTIKEIIFVSALFLFLSILFFTLSNIYSFSTFKIIAIVLLTTSYHFSIRLIIGEIITIAYRNKDFNCNGFFLREKKFEKNCMK